MQSKAFSSSTQALQYFIDRMHVQGIKLPANGTCFRTITNCAWPSSLSSVGFLLHVSFGGHFTGRNALVAQSRH
jgi:hypothetical protein